MQCGMMKCDSIGGPIKVIRSYLIICVTFCLIACSSSKKINDLEEIYSYSCPEVIASEIQLTLPIDSLTKDSLLNSIYTIEELQLINAFGSFRDLQRFEQAKYEVFTGTGNQSLLSDFILLSNRIDENLAIAELELQTVEDLIECNILKLKKYRNRLMQINLEKETNLTKWGVITGATATVVTAGVLISEDEETINSSFFDWLAVASGVAATWFAIESGRVDAQIVLKPGRNFVSCIYEGENQGQFPFSTWYLLNQAFEYQDTMISPRDYIIEEWKSSYEYSDITYDDAISVLTKEEAKYNQRLIEHRIEMLELLGVGIDQIARTLYLLRTKMR